MTTKKKPKIKKRERKSDCLITVLANVTKQPTRASIILDRRLNNMLSSCKCRDKKYGRDTHITVGMLRELAKTVIGTLCPYCGTVIDHKNISMDHIVPLSRGGNSEIENTQLICITCNKQKDKLFDYEFKELKKLIDSFSDESKKYINKKLSMQGGFHGFYKKQEESN